MKAFLKASRSKKRRDDAAGGDEKVNWAMPDDGEDIETMIKKSSPVNQQKAENEQSTSEVNSDDIEAVEKDENAEDLLWQTERRTDIDDLAQLNDTEKNEGDGVNVTDRLTDSSRKADGVVAVPLSRFESGRSEEFTAFYEECAKFSKPSTPDAINPCFSLSHINASNLDNVEERDQVRIRYGTANISRRTSKENAMTEAKKELPKLVNTSSFK